MTTTLQINIAPTDLPHLIHILPHQIRQLGGQVDEILLTLDLHQSRGRFSAAWKERLPGLLEFVERLSVLHPKLRTHTVDYSPETVAAISKQFFGSKTIPPKDWNGGPFYSYFSGFANARHNYIFHLDSDMMFGGGNQTWVAEAKQLMESRPDVVVCNPHPGPPTDDGSLRSQTLVPEPYTSLAFRADNVSTRLAFFSRKRFIERLAPLPLLEPSIVRRWQARLEGNFPYMLPEAILTTALQRAGLGRIDFLGQPPGMWSIHPPHRNAEFYQRLPQLIDAIERGEMPEGQLGHHDINDSMVDWSSVRGDAWRRKLGRLRLIFSRLKAAKT